MNTDLKSDHKPIAVTLKVDESEYIIDRLLHKSGSFMCYKHLTKLKSRVIRYDKPNTPHLSLAWPHFLGGSGKLPGILFQLP